MTEDLAVVDWKGLKALGLPWSRTHVWRQMDKGKFPRCFKLADDPKSRVVWYVSDVRAWMLERASRGRKPPTP